MIYYHLLNLWVIIFIIRICLYTIYPIIIYWSLLSDTPNKHRRQVASILPTDAGNFLESSSATCGSSAWPWTENLHPQNGWKCHLVGGFKHVSVFHFIYGMSSFPLTFIFFRGVETTNQSCVAAVISEELSNRRSFRNIKVVYNSVPGWLANWWQVGRLWYCTSKDCTIPLSCAYIICLENALVLPQEESHHDQCLACFIGGFITNARMFKSNKTAIYNNIYI